MRNQRAATPRSAPERSRAPTSRYLHSAAASQAGFLLPGRGRARLDLEILSIGRAGDAPKDSCLFQMTGRFLAYDVLLDGRWIFLSAEILDRADPRESLASFADGPDGWRQICSIVRCLERDQIKSLAKPIELGGGSGPNGWVIT
jgi:hypothetical protein